MAPLQVLEEGDTVVSEEGRVKRWVSARASFQVRTPVVSSGRNRMKKLKKEKAALKTGLSRSPYVDIELEGEKLPEPS